MGVTVSHHLPNAKYILNNDYDKMLGKSWTKAFGDFLTTDYMTNLAFFIDQVYKRKNSTCSQIVLPRNQQDVFTPWLRTPFDEVRVVILSEEPISYASNGLGYGNHHLLNRPTKCKMQLKMIQNLKKNALIDENTIFDNSLESWAEQGILMINVGMVSAVGHDNKYYNQFKGFVRQTLESICEQKTDVIFCFMSKKVKEDFADVLDKDQHELYYNEWDENTEIFEDVNALLYQNKDFLIKW